MHRVGFFLAICLIFTVVTAIHAFPTTSSLHGPTARSPTVFRGRSYKNPRQDFDTCPRDILLNKAILGRAQRFKSTQKKRDEVLLRAVARDEGTHIALADEHVSTSSTVSALLHFRCCVSTNKNGHSDHTGNHGPNFGSLIYMLNTWTLYFQTVEH